MRRATEGDASFYHRLWTCPEVMRNVGFPQGLRTTMEEIRSKIRQQPNSDLGSLLVVTLKSTGDIMGECKMYPPDEEGISETDVKLLPEYWGHGYGREIKSALLDQLFERTGCEYVQATPNVNNTSSIRMQESVGGIRMGEETYEFPEGMRSYT
ncbi:MAG: GNAT family N-acetyltransferase, partial [Candidatus Aegiribacteria sp.]|nr:GNAT family N-acetyltransferase [Candidatus Aegiribacteria sp.]MBD3294703.1 GNAT family N-acetyltransferase [Candidatus Fermentibacteria bacterium]